MEGDSSRGECVRTCTWACMAVSVRLCTRVNVHMQCVCCKYMCERVYTCVYVCVCERGREEAPGRVGPSAAPWDPCPRPVLCRWRQLLTCARPPRRPPVCTWHLRGAWPSFPAGPVDVRFPESKARPWRGQATGGLGAARPRTPGTPSPTRGGDLPLALNHLTIRGESGSPRRGRPSPRHPARIPGPLAHQTLQPL